jgi:ribose/xylose/arabinose/galactoside ABC-type transport system permease subunit
MDIQRLLIGLGVLLVIVGIAWPLLTRSGVGRLPGDIMFHRGGVTFYFPLVTCIIVSVVLSALFWLFNR